jgi:hypothetical protein
MYGKVPAVMKVWLNVAPGPMVGEKNRLFVEVTLCAMTSLLVHLTVVPTATLTESGTYAVVVREEAPIGIDTGVGVVPPGVGVGVVGEAEPPPQPASATTHTHMRRLARGMCFMYCLFCSVFHCSSGTLNRSDPVALQLLDRSLARSGLPGSSVKRSIFAQPMVIGRKYASLERLF